MDKHDVEGLSKNYCEYIVEAKCEGRLLIRKLLVILLVAVLAIVPSIFILRYAPVTEVVYLVIVAIVYLFFRRFFCIEYEYVVAGAEISVDAIYAKRSRKSIVKIPFSAIAKIIPNSEKNKHELDGIAAKNRIYAGRSEKDKKLYCIIYDNAAHEKNALFINVAKKSIDTFKYYRSSLVEIDNNFID